MLTFPNKYYQSKEVARKVDQKYFGFKNMHSSSIVDKEKYSKKNSLINKPS